MSQAAQNQPSPSIANFAGVLASLAARIPKSPATPWSEDELESDYVTLSYDKALRAHARYAPAEMPENPLAEESFARTAVGDSPTPDLPSAGFVGSGVAESRDEFASQPSRAQSSLSATPNVEGRWEPSASTAVSHDKGLKCASITIRLSQPECEQIRLRAAEAGLTVSAYLRSCTLEVESLRAMVKKTMAEMRVAAKPRQQPESPTSDHWMRRLMPFKRGSHPATA